MRPFLLVAGYLILLLTEIGRVFFIMPFPGSQRANTIDFAYFIQEHLGLFRLVGILVLAWPLYHYFRQGSRTAKLVTGSVLVVYVVVFYLFNFKFLAEKMFYQPTKTILVPEAESKIGKKQLVLGVTINGESKAYPIEIIGYHHQVRDVVGGEPIMVTYCTVCRTGRVYSPKVGGTVETFRLVGMDHFNAMFEDKTTKSWWRQVSGEAIAGPLKGTALKEIPAEQMSLSSWIEHNPSTLIMQEDSVFRKEYDGMKNYDEGLSKGELTRHDQESWKDKSWVLGIATGMNAPAYDWNDLLRSRVINDEVQGLPVLIGIQEDSVSFHAWDRVAGGETLSFAYDPARHVMIDDRTGSQWDWTGGCIDGKLKGTRLKPIQSYQEFWHSWKTFHPQTTQYLTEASTAPKKPA